MEDNPKTYMEAMASRDSTFWKKVIQDEIDPIMSNYTWEILVNDCLKTVSFGDRLPELLETLKMHLLIENELFSSKIASIDMEI